MDAVSEGHCGLPREELIGKTMELREVEEELITHTLAKEMEDETQTKNKFNQKAT